MSRFINEDIGGDGFADHEDRKKNRARRKSQSRQDHRQGGDKRIKRVGSDHSRWKFDPRKIDVNGEDDDYFEEGQD